ncbi:MAG TPA: VWA domain-containing protein [Candidatus Merdisoma merdipullorum]|nr:VWA domain-containing protein [Candidatus Merdisoma merdipullorum]
MFCTKCGKQIEDSAVFCRHCGNPVKRKLQSQKEPEGSCTEDTAEETEPEESSEEEPVNFRRKLMWPLLFTGMLLVAIVLGVIVFQLARAELQYRDLIGQAESYVEEEDYEGAEEAYLKALELKKNRSEAVLGMARVYILQQKLQQAEEALANSGMQESGEYQRLLEIAGFELSLEGIDTAHFPIVRMNLNCNGNRELTSENITILEDGQEFAVTDYQQQGNAISLQYETADSGYESERRNIRLSVRIDEFVFEYTWDYDTPVFLPADVQVVSTDVSEYPKVKVYLRVDDAQSQDTVEALGADAFVVRERLEGGEYLAREVHSAEILEGNQGLNIVLAADKSNSIYESDMEKIKQVMGDFVLSLHYEVGDKAEILAFDSIVQQMCRYTDDTSLLINGIHNMSPDGLTALYDAIYTGINHAGLQGGARCVIAFTDGMDNMSSHTPDQVIEYALTNQVPVYIIGVGDSVAESTLRYTAESTGGRYWYIDELYDLEEIFNEIYTEQKKLYVVEYESDSSIDAYQWRQLDIRLSGNGYKGETEFEFEPVHSLGDVEHTSRYEIFREDLTWEQAAQRCQDMGGHLATVTSEDEENILIQMAEDAGIDFVWLGGYTSYDENGQVFGHWVTGEEFSYEAWCQDEPSRIDKDGTEEWYIMLWNIPALGGWTWNDQRNDPASAMEAMRENMGYICEFDS